MGMMLAARELCRAAGSDRGIWTHWEGAPVEHVTVESILAAREKMLGIMREEAAPARMAGRMVIETTTGRVFRHDGMAWMQVDLWELSGTPIEDIERARRGKI